MISEKDKKVIQQLVDDGLKELNKRVQNQMLEEMRREEEHDFCTAVLKGIPTQQNAGAKKMK